MPASEPENLDNSKKKPGDGDREENTEIDLHALAEKILQLFKEESRLERERQGLRRF